MKIGVFTDTYVPEVNGVANSTLMLRDELTRRGHQVFVFAPSLPSAKGAESGVFRIPSMPLLVLPSRRVSWFYHPRLADMIKNTGLDVIHSQTEFSLGAFARMMASSLEIAQVHTYHTIYEDYTHYITRGLFDGYSKKVVRRYSRFYCNMCEHVLAPSEKTRALLEEYGVHRPIDIVPTGVDIRKFEKSLFSPEQIREKRRELGIEPDAKVILNIGRISKEKNIQEIIRGLPPLLARHPEARMLLVGGGPYADTLRDIAREEGIQDKLIFAGEQPWSTIGLFYALGDVFISASTSETQGLTYIEAMSAQLPVVARADKAIEGLIEHEKSGLLFSGAEQIASCLERALYDQSLRQSIVPQALQTARSNSLETFGQRVENAYLAALESKKSRSA